MFRFPTTFHLLAGLGHFFAPWRREDREGGDERESGRRGGRRKGEVRREEGRREERGEKDAGKGKKGGRIYKPGMGRERS